jgi:hypothetical protein
MNLNKKHFYILIIILIALAAAMFLLSPAKFPADDGFFYLQIANNLVHGNGSTFNEIYSTNGYHPLWLLVCVAASLVSFGIKELLIYVVWLVQIILFFFSIIILKKIIKNNTEDYIFRSLIKSELPFLAATAVLTFVFLGTGTLYMSEAFLYLLCLIIVMRTFLKDANNTKNNIFFGLALSALLLARLDNVFLASIILIFYCFKNKNNILKRLIITSFILIMMIFPYLLWNYWNFGNIVPISGAIKSNFPVLKFNGLDLYGKILFIVCVLYLILLLFQDR